MNNSIIENVDDEIDRYNRAQRLAEFAPPLELIKNKTVAYNKQTGANEILLPMQGGGYVKVGEMPKEEQPPAEADAPTNMQNELPILEGFGDKPIKEFTKGLVRGGVVKPAKFLEDNFGIYNPLRLQILNPDTGELDLDFKILSQEEVEKQRAANKGKPFYFDIEELVKEDEEAGIGAGLAGGLGQFLGAYVGLAKYFKLGQSVLAKGFTRGAAADFLAFEGDEGRITDILVDLGVDEKFIPSFLVTDPNDPDYVGRFKTAFEGGGLGIVAESLMFGIGRTFRAIKDRDVPAEEVQQITKNGQRSIKQIIVDRLNQRGDMPTVGSMGANVFAPGDPKLITDPLLKAGGEATLPKAENITLGEASNTPMVSQLAPQYRVTLNGVQPGGTGKQSFIPKAMTPGNFSRASTNLDTISQEFADPLSSPENYALMMGSVQNSIEVPAPPKWMIEHANDMDKWSDWFGGLTDTQIKAADEGLAVQNSFKQAYSAGADTELTGQLMLWSILSRRLSAFPHESGYLDLAQAATPYIQKAARGEWSDADTANWLEMVKTTIPAGTPGKSATSNANDFGKVFLKKMAAVDEEGVSALTRLHQMIADPNMSSAQIRRAYYGLAEDTGIANKILSFALLVSGRNDVVVLDRIQINRMWAGGDKIYDDVYKQFEGAQGLAQYEALERSLQNRVQTLYEKVGRGDKGSVGRYHWESWVLSSGQVVSHPTLETVVKTGAPDPKRNIPPTASTPVMEGRFNKWYSGVQYEQMPDGSNRYIYKTSDGTPFQFTKKSLDDMLNKVKKKSSGVLPSDFPGVTSFEGGNMPWYEYDGVDRGKIDKFIREAGKPIS